MFSPPPIWIRSWVVALSARLGAALADERVSEDVVVDDETGANRAADEVAAVALLERAAGDADPARLPEVDAASVLLATAEAAALDPDVRRFAQVQARRRERAASNRHLVEHDALRPDHGRERLPPGRRSDRQADHRHVP